MSETEDLFNSVFGPLFSSWGAVIAYLIVGYSLFFAVSFMGRSRPDLDIRLPIAVAVIARILTSLAVQSTGVEMLLRGWDELVFLQDASKLKVEPWSLTGDWGTAITSKLHVAMFAAQEKAFGMKPEDLRITQIGVSVLGLAFLSVAVHDMVGPKPARLAAWLLALEPAGMFFDGALHKEPLMVLASGLVIFGGTKLWRDPDLRNAVPLGLGVAIGMCARPYVGVMLLLGSILLTAHAVLRNRHQTLRVAPIVIALIVVSFAAAPLLAKQTSSKTLKSLQASQDANTQFKKDAEDQASLSAAGAESDGGGNNLALENVDVSTPDKAILALPRRISDILLRPYPWEADNLSQQLGGFASLVALALFAALIRYLWQLKRRAIYLTAPIAYPLAMLTVTYALSVGNAGTGFRYRTQIVTVCIALFVVVREGAKAQAPSVYAQAQPASGGPTRINQVAS